MQGWKVGYNKNIQAHQNSKHSITYQASQALKFTIAFGSVENLLVALVPRESRVWPRGNRSKLFSGSWWRRPQLWLARESLKSRGILPLTHVGFQEPSVNKQQSQGQIISNPSGSIQPHILGNIQLTVRHKLPQNIISKYLFTHQDWESPIPQVTPKWWLKDNTDQLPIYINPYTCLVWKLWYSLSKVHNISNFLYNNGSTNRVIVLRWKTPRVGKYYWFCFGCDNRYRDRDARNRYPPTQVASL